MFSSGDTEDVANEYPVDPAMGDHRDSVACVTVHYLVQRLNDAFFHLKRALPADGAVCDRIICPCLKFPGKSFLDLAKSHSLPHPERPFPQRRYLHRREPVRFGNDLRGLDRPAEIGTIYSVQSWRLTSVFPATCSSVPPAAS